MREIKFRGDTPDGRRVYGGIHMLDDETVSIVIPCSANGSSCALVQVRPETVSQYTGFQDSCGNEIYENDLVRLMWKVSDEISTHWHIKIFQVRMHPAAHLVEISPDVSHGRLKISALEDPRITSALVKLDVQSL